MEKPSYFHSKWCLERKASCGIRQDETRQSLIKKTLLRDLQRRGKHKFSFGLAGAWAVSHQRQRPQPLELSFWLVDRNGGGRVEEGEKHSQPVKYVVCYQVERAMGRKIVEPAEQDQGMLMALGGRGEDRSQY